MPKTRRKKRVGPVPAKVREHRRFRAEKPKTATERRNGWLLLTQFVAITHPSDEVKADALALLKRQDDRNERRNNRHTLNGPTSKYGVGREMTKLEDGIVQNVGRLPALPPKQAKIYNHRVEARKLKRMRQLADRSGFGTVVAG